MPVFFTNYSQIRYVQPIEGEIVFTSNGNFTVPNGVSSISILAVGGGGAGGGLAATTERATPGAGGALAYVNDVSVTPGEVLTVVVGQRGLANNNAGKPGGNSYVRRSNTDLVHAGGGAGGFWYANNTFTAQTANGGIVVVGTGGPGGNSGSQAGTYQGGGGGAGGYAGRGGRGVVGDGNGGSPPVGSGGGAGGGRFSLLDGGDGGGGVGIYGIGSNGSPGNGVTPSTGGSGGGSSQGVGTDDFGGYGGDYGGGGGTAEETTAPQVGGNGGNGVVRIIWSDSRPRQFPNTNVDGTTVIYYYTKLLLYGEGANNSNNFVDSSFKGKTLSTIGSPIMRTDNFVFGNSSIFLNGSSALTISSDIDFQLNNEPFTLEAWIRSSDSGITNRAIMAMGSAGSTANWQLNIHSDNTLMFFYKGVAFVGDTIVSTTLINQNTWYHVAVSYDGSIIRLFVNGTLESQVTYSAVYSDYSILKIGQNRGSTTFFSGYIDNLRITRGIARYTNSFTVPVTSFVPD